MATKLRNKVAKFFFADRLNSGLELRRESDLPGMTLGQFSFRIAFQQGAYMRLKSVFRQSTAVLALGTAVAGFAAAPASADILQLYEGYFYQTSADTSGQVFGVAARDRAEALPGTGGVTLLASDWNQTAQQIANVSGGNGAGAIIAIIDSGVDLDHPEFAGRILTGACFGDSIMCATAGNLVGGDEGVATSNPTHGTFVASVAAGATTGVAPGAWILPVKVCSTTSLSCPGDIYGGVIWAATTGNADIINLSLGGSFNSSSALNAAITAVNNGALLVVSAGNGGSRRTSSGSPAGVVLENGVIGAMIVVGATGAGNQLASFSETPGTFCKVSGTSRVCTRDYFVVAPGQGVVAAGGGNVGNFAVDGTSFSSPYVAGVAALVKGAAPYLTNYQIADIIFSTTIDLGAVGSDRVFGRGAVNAQAALDAVGISSLALSGSSTSGYSGSGDVRGARISGPVAQAIAGSRLLRSAVVLDAYTRDFRFDMTRGAGASGFTVFGSLNRGSAGYSPVAGAFGGVSFSAIVAEDTTMGIADPLMLREDRARTDVFNAIATFSASDSMDVTLGFNTSMAGLGADYDLASSPAYDGLFLSASAMNSPYLRLADGGLFAGVAYDLTDTLTLRTSIASYDSEESEELPVSDQELKLRRATHFQTLEADRGADAVAVGLDWAVASWAGLGLSATSVTEYNAILGGEQIGALSIADTATTRAVTLQGRVSLGDGFILSGAWNEGTTSIDTPANGLFSNVEDLHSRAYGLAVSKIGVFGQSDLIGFAVSRPLHIVGGSGELTIATDINGDRTLVYGTEAINFGWDALQTDYELGYSAMLFDGAVGFELNAAYQQNVGGFEGDNGVAVATRFGLEF